MLRSALFRSLSIVVSLFLSLAVAEVILRLSHRIPLLIDERNTLYRYDALLGWSPLPHVQGLLKGSRHVHVSHNAQGFRDRDHLETKQPVLLVLGDSFVYGYDVEAGERFTDLLQQRLPSWDIYNLGVSGYGTDQEYILLKQVLPNVKPTRVLLVFCQNDTEDNTTNKRYGYYKPYFIAHENQLELQGVPVPRGVRYSVAAHPLLFKSRLVTALVRAWITAHAPVATVTNPTIPLLLSMKQYLATHHVDFKIGFIHMTQPQKKFCHQIGLSCVDLHSDHVYPDYGSHWTPEGHREIAEQLYPVLRKAS